MPRTTVINITKFKELWQKEEIVFYILSERKVHVSWCDKYSTVKSQASYKKLTFQILNIKCSFSKREQQYGTYFHHSSSIYILKLAETIN